MAWFAVVSLVLTPEAWAEGRPSCLKGGGAAVEIVAVEAPDLLRMGDGRFLRLSGLDSPRRLGRDGMARDAARLEAARAALAGLVIGRGLRLHVSGPVDRRGRVVGHLVDAAEGTWVNGEMARLGHMWVVPVRTEETCVRALLRLEDEARQQAAGLWSEAEFRPVGADDTELPSRADTYALVEGAVRSTGRAGRRRYIDFGDDHRSDFTVVIRDADWARFAAAGIAWDRLKGRRIRVRGWLTAHQGMEMTLDAPEELEWLDRPE